MAEEWRPVAGYGGAYEASSLGRVRSWKAGPVRSRRAPEPTILHQSIRSTYRCVSLSDGAATSHSVHQLVARAFLGEPEEGQQVCHIDGNPNNNARDNLRYGTARDNAADRDRHGRSARGETVAQHKLSAREVLEIRAIYMAGGMTQREIGEIYGVTHSAISLVVRAKNWAWIGEAA